MLMHGSTRQSPPRARLSRAVGLWWKSPCWPSEEQRDETQKAEDRERHKPNGEQPVSARQQSDQATREEDRREHRGNAQLDDAIPLVVRTPVQKPHRVSGY